MQHADLSAEQIKRLYEKLIRKLTPLFSEIAWDTNQPFSFEEFPKISHLLEEYLRQWREEMQISIEKNMTQSWGLSVEKNRQIFEKYLSTGLLTAEEILRYNNQNTDALQAFLKRKTEGLTLSDRVWKLSKQFKEELEMSLDLGLLQGKSAQQISRDIGQYLNEPGLLFRRVRDARGNLHLSKRAEAYHPGQGVYRSSYNNAMRLARTEVNMAYRASDLEKYRQADFVLGYEIKRSNHPFGCPVCEGLKGKYPKDFQFVGWHPNCRCFTVPILQPVDDFVKGLKGEEVLKNQVNQVPDNFKQWVKDNSERMQKAQSVPYWWKDNQKYTNLKLQKEIKELAQKAKKSEKELLNIAQKIAKEHQGKISGINFKTENSIFRKVVNELNGDVSQIKDSIRTTIILSDKNYIFFLENIKKITIFARLKIQNPKDFVGYSGILTNIKTKNGIFAEIQFNTEKMIYAKENPKDAIRIIGQKRWNEINKEVGLEGGLGHKFYEEMRILDKKDPIQLKKWQELEKKSIEYYSKFR